MKRGDCLEILKTYEANHFDALVTDPPAGISFMGKAWDSDKGGRDGWVKWMTEVMRETLRVMKPGAHGLVWAIPRTSHWTATALELAGFEIRDVITHLFGSGFPKSLDISKAIDKSKGAEGPVIGKNPAYRENEYTWSGGQGHTPMRPEFKHGPATDLAKQWEGWGTALKPASEHWILIRKPCSEKTVAKNVEIWGVGGLNIDACRVAHNEPCKMMKAQTDKEAVTGGGKVGRGGRHVDVLELKPNGRFPANLVLSHHEDCEEDWCVLWCPVHLLDEQSGKLAGAGNSTFKKTEEKSYSGGLGGFGDKAFKYDLGGGASRFFYCAKSSKKDRNAGLEGEPIRKGQSIVGNNNWQGERYDGAPLPQNQNPHPTVKSSKLMEYLCKLITPPKGKILDPFMGSGSTGVAAVRAGFQFEGIEQDEVYFRLAEKRVEHAST